MEQIAQEFVRALRGRRSQRALSARLGYRSNPVALWETGRRFPTAAEALRVCKVVRINVKSAFERFHRPTAASFEHGDDGVAKWLRATRGEASIADVSARVGASRYAVSRWLAGKTRPRLPDFLRLVEALTGRLADFVGELVPLEKIPELAKLHEAQRVARKLSRDQPWTPAILFMLETEGYQALEVHDDEWLAQRLGIERALVEQIVGALEAAHIIARSGDLYEAVSELHTYSRGAALSRRKQHWAQVAAERMPNPRDRDYFTFVIGSMSPTDFELLRSRLR
jgi:transcriptional regulator with XRE-family HTH domain